MSKNKEDIINRIIDVEGGYVNDLLDSGGETNFGITIAVARENDFKGDMKDLPRELAYKIYEKQYWDKMNADSYPIPLANKLVDMAVNLGVSKASTFLQQSVNLFTDFNMKEDGIIGSYTISCLNQALKRHKHGLAVMIKSLNCLQGHHYINISEKYPKNKKFIYGWFNQRIS